MVEVNTRHSGVRLVATYSLAGKVAVVALHGDSVGIRDFFLYLPAAGVAGTTETVAFDCSF